MNFLARCSQATDLGGAHRAALDKAPMSARRLVEATLKRYSDRVRVAAAAMLDGGPLQLSLELLVVVSHPALHPRNAQAWHPTTSEGLNSAGEDCDTTLRGLRYAVAVSTHGRPDSYLLAPSGCHSWFR